MENVPNLRTLVETERVTAERLDHMDLDFAAARAVLTTYRAATAARRYLTTEVLRPADLTWTGFQVLWVLWIWQRMETRDVAEAVGVSKATLTGVTNTLVGGQLVRRSQVPADGRLVELVITEAGVELLEDLFPKFNVAEANLVSTLDSDEVAQLSDMLRRIVTFTDNEEKGPALTSA